MEYTIADLIQELQKYPQTTKIDVVIASSDWRNFEWIVNRDSLDICNFEYDKNKERLLLGRIDEY